MTRKTWQHNKTRDQQAPAHSHRKRGPDPRAAETEGAGGLTLSTLLDRLAEERERARRVLIMADMVARTGDIRWGRLMAWDYQPGEAEVEEALVTLRTNGSVKGVKGKASRRSA
jgi:hypothetical protein